MFTIEIETDNAAFHPDPTEQIAVILHTIIKRLRKGDTGGSERDANGNTVAKFHLEA